MSDPTDKPMTLDEATKLATAEVTADVKAWQDAKVRAAIKAADAGEFASPDEVREIIRKYIPHG